MGRLMFNENFLGFLKVYKQNIVAGRLFLFVDKTKANKCDCVSVRSSKQTVKMPKTKQKDPHSWRSLAPRCHCVFPSWWPKPTMGHKQITLKPLNICIHVWRTNQEVSSPNRCSVKYFLRLTKVIHSHHKLHVDNLLHSLFFLLSA